MAEKYGLKTMIGKIKPKQSDERKMREGKRGTSEDRGGEWCGGGCGEDGKWCGGA